MKNLLIGFIGISFILVFSLFAADAPEKVVLQAKMGNVTLPHKAHIETIKITCVTCHHTEKEGQAVEKCSKCHGTDPKAPAVKDAFHKLCQDCHKTKNEKEGKKAPTKCTQCHIKS